VRRVGGGHRRRAAGSSRPTGGAHWGVGEDFGRICGGAEGRWRGGRLMGSSGRRRRTA